MSKLSRSPPLKTVYTTDISRVKTYLNDPLLFRRQETSASIRQELALLKQLAQMELLMKKIHRLEIWKLKLDVSNKTLKDLRQRVLQLQMDIQINARSLAETTIQQIYPRASQILFDANSNQKNPSSDNQDWLPIQHLDQLYVTASRLYHDLNELQNLKYIAYQLALLYQCINRQGVSFVSYKVRIEQRFDEIKMATKKEPVYLNSDQKSWLQVLALDVIAQATDKSSVIKCGYIFNVMQQMAT